MNCDQTRELLPWLLNGTLEEPERGETLAHLKGCAECRAELAETRLAAALFAAHVPGDDLVAYAFAAPTTLDRDTIARHLALCPSCAGELELLAESRRQEVLPFRRPSRPTAPAGPPAGVWRWAALAAGLTALAASGGWMWSWQEAQSLAGLVAAERRAAETTNERLAGVERQAAELSATAAEARDRVAGLEAELASRGRGDGLHLNTLVIDLYPADAVVRGAGPAPAARALPGSAGLVTLILNLTSREEYPGYELRLRDARGGDVLRQRGLRRDPETGSFTVSVPTSLIGAGQATIEVYGVRGTEATQIASYPVEVSR